MIDPVLKICNLASHPFRKERVMYGARSLLALSVKIHYLLVRAINWNESRNRAVSAYGLSMEYATITW